MGEPADAKAKPSRDPERLIAAIRRFGKRHPDTRVGQMLVNAVNDKGELFYMENDVLAELLEKAAEGL